MGNTIIPSANLTQLLAHTFINNTEKVDISSFVQNYNELLIYVRPAAELRWQPPQVIPTDLLKVNQSFTMHFEGGMYTTSTAYTGYRFSISSTGSKWYVNGEWLYYEGNASNTVMAIFGR